MGRTPGAGGAVEAVLNLTGEHGNEPQYAAQEGRLASTIGPHQGKAFTAFDCKREVLEDDTGVVSRLTSRRLRSVLGIIPPAQL